MPQRGNWRPQSAKLPNAKKRFTTNGWERQRQLARATTAAIESLERRVLLSTAPGVSPLSRSVSESSGGVSALNATDVSASEIDLSWAASGSDASGINIYSSTDGINNTPLTPAPLAGDVTSFSARDLLGNTHYWFEVQAIEPTAPDSFATADAVTIPAAPSDLQAVANGPLEVDLSWSSNSDPTTSFNIERTNAGTGNFVVIGSTQSTTFADTTVNADSGYDYRVVAVGVAGPDSPSGPSNVTTARTPTPGGPLFSQSTSNVLIVGAHTDPLHLGGAAPQYFGTINAAAKVAAPGTTIYIHGGTYYESITPQNTGTATAPIIFRPYPGDGAVTVSGTNNPASPLRFKSESETLNGATVHFYTAQLPVSGLWGSTQQYILGPSAGPAAVSTDQIFQGGQALSEFRYPYANANVSAQTYPADAPANNPTLLEVPASGAYCSNVARQIGTHWVMDCTFSDPNLTQPDGFWVGAQIHILAGNANPTPYKSRWVAETAKVIAYTRGRITYRTNPGSSFTAELNRYGLSNAAYDEQVYGVCAGDLYYLFAPVETTTRPAASILNTHYRKSVGSMWYIDHSSSALSYSSSNSTPLYLHIESSTAPANIRVKVRDAGFDLRGKSNIVIHGINLFAATIYTSSDSGNDTIENITAQYLSSFDRTGMTDHNGTIINGWLSAGTPIATGIELFGDYDQLLNSTICQCAGDGVTVEGNGDVISGCQIHDVDTMATDSAAIYCGGAQACYSPTLDHNIVYNSGRSLIVHRNTYAAQITNNDISFAGLQTEDAGGTYTYGTNAQGTVIAHNIVHDIYGSASSGIYVDDNSSNVTIGYNIVYNAPTAVKLNRGNTGDNVYNNDLDAVAGPTQTRLPTLGTDPGPFSFDSDSKALSGNSYVNNLLFQQHPHVSIPGGSGNLELSAAAAAVNNVALHDFHLRQPMVQGALPSALPVIPPGIALFPAPQTAVQYPFILYVPGGALLLADMQDTTSYDIYWSTDPTTDPTAWTNLKRIAPADVSTLIHYYYVVARNANGASGMSNMIAI